MKRIIAVLITIIILASIIQIPANAAGTTIISFNKNTVTIGDKVIVTIKVNIAEPPFSLNFYVKYAKEKIK